MPNLLITDCLQHDFVGPVGRFQGLPNALHVGHDESLRLLGPEASEGPVARLVAWAHAQDDAALRVVHVRDWHDPSDPEQREHLEQFGTHCVRDSDGARFVFRTDDAASKHLEIVDATILSNFVGTRLPQVLEPLRGEPVRVGLMGVWTEAKITFLAYDLRARYPHFELGVCSALTASSSRANHFLALDQLDRILGVRVIDSVAAFVEFLGGARDAVPLLGFNDRHPTVVCDDRTRLDDVDARLLRYLFRGCREVRFKPLDGGFSGNRVLATRSIDLHGHEEVPHVVKIGPHGPMGQERTAFERIEAVLGNAAPRIADFADMGDRGGIKYRYAAMGRGQSRSLQKLFTGGVDDAALARVLDQVFDEQLGRLYRAATVERSDLLDYYDFAPKWGAGVRRKVAALLGEVGDEIAFGAHATLPHIACFYERALEALPRVARSHRYAWVHGDLNGANVLVDAPGNVWIIDFFHAHRGHVLRDLVKLENDLLYIWTPLDESELPQAYRFTDALLEVEDLGRELTDRSGEFESPALARAWRTAMKLRAFYPPLIEADREATQLLIAQIRYAVHTLGFEESSAIQKRWALYTASAAAMRLEQITTLSGPLRVDFLPDTATAPGRLGLTILPGRRDYGRDLEVDLDAIAALGIDAVVCLLADDEFARYGVDGLLERYRARGFELLHVPTVDGRVPAPEQLKRATSWIDERVRAGRAVLAHCVGGLGRAGTLAACWLRTRGVEADAAIRTVRAARSPRAIETTLQEAAIAAYQQ